MSDKQKETERERPVFCEIKRFLHFCPLLIKERKQEKITQRSVEDKKETRKLEGEKKNLVKRKR